MLNGVLDHTRDRATSVTQALGAVIVSGTKEPHKFDNLVELEETITNSVTELVRVKTEILRLIQRVPDRNQRLVLTAYYLDMATWEQVAVDMHYSFDNVMRLQRLGLAEVDRLLREQCDA